MPFAYRVNRMPLSKRRTKKAKWAIPRSRSTAIGGAALPGESLPAKDSARPCPEELPAPPGNRPSRCPAGRAPEKARLNSSSAMCPQRQDRRREANPPVVAGHPTIPNLPPRDINRPNPSLDRPHRAVTVPHNTVPTVGKLQVLHRGEKRRGASLSTVCARSRRAPVRRIFVSGSSISSG